jgi:hypothetical protein
VRGSTREAGAKPVNLHTSPTLENIKLYMLRYNVYMWCIFHILGALLSPVAGSLLVLIYRCPKLKQGRLDLGILLLKFAKNL